MSVKNKTILGKMNTGDIVSFSLYANSVISQSYDRVKIEGSISADFGHFVGADLYAMHAQVHRLLPPGTCEDDATSYQYLLIRLTNGNTTAVGIPWIDPNTIKVYESTRTTFTVEDMSQEDVNALRDAFARRGYSPVINIVKSD